MFGELGGRGQGIREEKKEGKGGISLILVWVFIRDRVGRNGW
jgi:hypothetical protein